MKLMDILFGKKPSIAEPSSKEEIIRQAIKNKYYIKRLKFGNGAESFQICRKHSDSNPRVPLRPMTQRLLTLEQARDELNSIIEMEYSVSIVEEEIIS